MYLICLWIDICICIFSILHFVDRRKFLAIRCGKHWLNIHFSLTASKWFTRGWLSRERLDIRGTGMVIILYLSLHPRINARLLFSLAPPRHVVRRAFAVTRGTCQRDARTKRFGTGSTKSAVARARRTMRTCEEGQDERVREGVREKEKERWRRGARERRFKGKKEEVAAIKKERAEKEGERELEEQGGGGRAWRTGRNLRSSAGSSALSYSRARWSRRYNRERAAAALHGKASRFASDNGAMTVFSRPVVSPPPKSFRDTIGSDMII